MFKKQKIVFLLLVSFFITSISFAQEQKQSGQGSGPTSEQLIEGMQQEKEKALKSGDKGKAEAIDAMIKDFKGGKITAEQIMKQGAQDKSAQGDPQQGSGGFSQQKGQPSGMSSPGGDMSKGSFTTQGQKGGSNMQQGMQGGSQQGTPTKEKVLKELQKLKEKSIAAGNMEEAKKMHAEIENIRAGKSDFTKSSGGDGPTQMKEGLEKQGDNP